MLITFFDMKGLVHFEFFPQGQTVNQAYYVKYISSNMELCTEKGMNFGPTIVFSFMTMLQLTSKQFLPQKLIIEMEHPSFSLDLVLNDFWLFPETKSDVKG
jgi:hypothetical protein